MLESESKVVPAAQPHDGPLVEAARRVEHGAQAARTRIAEAAREKVEVVREKRLGELWDGARDGVREHPVTTALVALGVGAVVGLLVGRRLRS